MCPHAAAPDDRGGGDEFPGRQPGTVGVDGGNRHAGAGFHLKRTERLCDDGAGAIPHVRSDPRRPVGKNDPAGLATGDRAQPCREFGRRLDPGQPAADHQSGEPAGRGGPAPQVVQVRRQPRRRS